MEKQEFLTTLEASCAALDKYITKEETIELCKQISNILDGSLSLKDAFGEGIGSGSYKDAYRFSDVCVKFSNNLEIMEKEIDAYNCAIKFGIQHIFCPSVFIKMPTANPLALSEFTRALYTKEPLSEGSNKEWSYFTPNATHIIIQPMIVIDEDQARPMSPCEYDEAPLILKDGSALPASEYLLLDAPLEWQESIIELYGDLAYRDISWGLRRLNITDLHNGNVGWLDDKPVILDWLSFSDQSVKNPRL